MESDARFFRRRAAEEMAAAERAVTAAARDRRLQLARSFTCRLDELQKRGQASHPGAGGDKPGAVGLASMTHA